MIFQQLTYDEMLQVPRLMELVQAYTDGANYKSFHKSVDLELYKALADKGLLDITAVFDEDDAKKLIGFFSLILTRTPHAKDQTIATCDSLFLDEKSRKGMAGVEFLRQIEDRAKAIGADSLFLATGSGTRAEQLFECLSERMGIERLSTMWAIKL